MLLQFFFPITKTLNTILRAKQSTLKLIHQTGHYFVKTLNTICCFNTVKNPFHSLLQNTEHILAQ